MAAKGYYMTGTSGSKRMMDSNQPPRVVRSGTRTTTTKINLNSSVGSVGSSRTTPTRTSMTNKLRGQFSNYHKGCIEASSREFQQKRSRIVKSSPSVIEDLSRKFVIKDNSSTIDEISSCKYLDALMSLDIIPIERPEIGDTISLNKTNVGLFSKKTDVWLSHVAELNLNSETELHEYAQAMFDGFLDPEFLAMTEDVEVLADGVVFKTHRILLAYHSPKLAGMVVTYTYAKTSTVKLTLVPSNVFSVIYNWMYGQLVDFAGICVGELLRYSSELGFEALKHECLSYTTKHMDPRYSPLMFDFASKHGHDSLRTFAVNQMAANFSVIVADDQFVNLPLNSVLQLLSLEDIYAKDETDILLAAFRWLSHRENLNAESVDRWKHAEEILKCIRLENMTPSEFLSIGTNLNDVLVDDIKSQEWIEQEMLILGHFISTLSGLPSESTLKHQSRRRNLGKNPPESKLPVKDLEKKLGAESFSPEVFEPHVDARWNADFTEDRYGSATDEDDDASLRLEIVHGSPHNPLESTERKLSNVDDILASVSENEVDDWLSHVTKIEMNESKQRASRCLNFIWFLKDTETLPLTSDLVISCQGKLFNVHKIIMAYHIPELQEHICTRHACLKPTVMIYGMSARCFTMLVLWMYAGGVQLCGTDGVSLKRAIMIGKRLGCTRILERTKRLTAETLDLNSALLAIKTSSDSDDSEKKRLGRVAYDCITRQITMFANKGSFKSLDFESVKWILSNDDIFINSEMDVLVAAMRWLNANVNDRSKYAAELLGCVRWSLLSLSELLRLTKPCEASSVLTLIYPGWRLDLLKGVRLKVAELCNYKPLLDCNPVCPRNNIGKLNETEMQIQNGHLKEDFKPDRCRIIVHGSPPHSIQTEMSSKYGDNSVVGVGKTAEFGDDSEFDLESAASSLSEGSENEKHYDNKVNKSEVRKSLNEVSTILESSNGSIVLIGKPKNTNASLLVINFNDRPLKTSTAEVPDQRKHSSAVILGDHVYVIGGSIEPLQVISTVCRFSLLTNRWESVKSMLHARARHGCAVCLGVIYICGGVGDREQLLYTVEAFHPSTKTWTPVRPMLKPRHSLSVAAHKGQVWAVGGMSVDDAGNDYMSDAVERYSPDGNCWILLTRLRSPRMGSVLLSNMVDDRLYLIGGQALVNGHKCNIINVDVFENEQWLLETELKKWRRNSAATVLDGRVLVVAYFDSIQYYDLKSKSWLLERGAKANSSKTRSSTNSFGITSSKIP